MVPEDTMSAFKEGKQPTVLPSYKPQQGPAWPDNPKTAVLQA